MANTIRPRSHHTHAGVEFPVSAEADAVVCPAEEVAVGVAAEGDGAGAIFSHRYLSMTERQRIESLYRHGVGVREVARRLGRSPSTISRELRRNTARHDRGGYDTTLTHSRAPGPWRSTG